MRMDKCPECGSTKLERNTDGEYCKKCGLVISDAIYSGSREIF